MKIDPREAQELLYLVEGIAPVAQKAGALAKPLLRDAVLALADIRADAVLRYESRGFTREHAIQLAIADMQQLRDALKSSRTP
jgi:hypothetical protein